MLSSVKFGAPLRSQGAPVSPLVVVGVLAHLRVSNVPALSKPDFIFPFLGRHLLKYNPWVPSVCHAGLCRIALGRCFNRTAGSAGTAREQAGGWKRPPIMPNPSKSEQVPR